MLDPLVLGNLVFARDYVAKDLVELEVAVLVALLLEVDLNLVLGWCRGWCKLLHCISISHVVVKLLLAA